MAGISVPQYEIFKIGTGRLEYAGWDLEVSREEAFLHQELVSLFESQLFRLMADKVLGADISGIDFTRVFLQVVVERKSDFARATGRKGVTVNGVNFRRLIGTTGGLKNNTLLFCASEYIDELGRLCECGRNPAVKLVPAKYEANKAFTCSASQPICEPRGILVVSDCMTPYRADVLSFDDGGEGDEPSMEFVEGKSLVNNATDGFGVCTIGYMRRVAESLGLSYVPGGVCLRNAWLKGMLYPFPIAEFVEEFNGGNYIVRDIWGDERDIRDCEMILTESSLKLWEAYGSIEDYARCYRECGYGFAVTKISPERLDSRRELNYQYLQSYDFTDADIDELCAPTIKYLKDSMCGDYEATLRFLGICGGEEPGSWQRALALSPHMMEDPYVIGSVHRLIRKKMDDAKIGRLMVDGNYQIASGDPFTLMQSACGLEPTGLLSAGECYSRFWDDRGAPEVVVFRSPMTSHNNIRKCRVSASAECRMWYRHMGTIMVINSWDSFCMAENGCDYDSDILFSTDNPVLKRRYRELPAIECVQRNAEKVFITERDVKTTNRNGMGNKVGMITNYVTSMMEVQSHFEEGSAEHEELRYRIACGQLYQQNELDKIKGIVATRMPGRWYNTNACGDDARLRSICAYRKPYFMIYVYPELRKRYMDFVRESDAKCRILYGMPVEELRSLPSPSRHQAEFLEWYDRKLPVGTGGCAMNRICRHVERELDGCRARLKKESGFDYSILKTGAECADAHRDALWKIERYYRECVSEQRRSRDAGKDGAARRRRHLARRTRRMTEEACPDDGERLDIILDMAYAGGGSRQFCWDAVGGLICERLEDGFVYTG